MQALLLFPVIFYIAMMPILFTGWMGFFNKMLTCRKKRSKFL
jgi:hypothetical protein